MTLTWLRAEVGNHFLQRIREKIFEALRASWWLLQLHNTALVTKSSHKCGWVPIKLYLWALPLNFILFSDVMKYSFVFITTKKKKVKIILSSVFVQKARGIWPAGYSHPIISFEANMGIFESSKHMDFHIFTLWSLSANYFFVYISGKNACTCINIHTTEST